ncbi:MAG: metallophosphoesterase [candidate division Zixibacteria bacterium]|nr:metallophosphoesterase [candidate division Zixibacteria bacterium]
MKEHGRIFVTGDIHGNPIPSLSKKHFPIGKELSKKDVVIILGDFGLLWSKYRSKDEEHNLKWLDDQPWTTLFIDGNHENFDILENLPEKELYGDVVGIVGHSIFHLRRGICYRINGQKCLTIGGAHSHDRQYRTWGKSMWKQEEITDEDIKKAKESVQSVGFDVDYILTHCAPTNWAMGAMPQEIAHMWQPDGSEERLQWFKDTSGVDFKKWFCGHYHTNFGPRIRDDFECIYHDVKEL